MTTCCGKTKSGCYSSDTVSQDAQVRWERRLLPATLLKRGEPCTRQLLRLGDLVYGFAWSHGKAFARILSMWLTAFPSTNLKSE